MTTTTKVLVSAAGLILLLVVGLILAQAGGSDGANSPNSGVTQSPTVDGIPTPVDPEAEVRQAYLHYWDVFAAAFRSVSTEDLDEVVTGKALRVLGRQMQDLRETGLFVRVRVQHDIGQIRVVDATTAVVVDRLTNHSVTVDRATGRPTEKDPNELIVEAYTLKKEDGIWKVSAISRR